MAGRRTPKRKRRENSVEFYLDGVDVGLAGGVLLDEAGPAFLPGREGADDPGLLLRQPLGAQAPDLPASIIGVRHLRL